MVFVQPTDAFDTQTQTRTQKDDRNYQTGIYRHWTSNAMSKQHLLILGASGENGVDLLNQVISLGTSAPFITVYVRQSGRAKLPKAVSGSSNIRIVEGGLTDRSALKKALNADGSFPQATAVISFLGAYMSLYYFLTRHTPHPIADAFTDTILPTMGDVGVKRILALSTPSAFQYPEETANLTWGAWAMTLIPKFVVPQANAEMVHIAQAVLLAGAHDDQLEWTVYRVPQLTQGDANAVVSAGELFKDYSGTWELTRGSLNKWLLAEVEERKHIRRAPMVGNVAQ